MFAIAAIKRKVDRLWDEEKELLWASLPTDEAIKEACITSTPLLKRRMFRFMASALESLTGDVVSLCWDASSLATALFAQPPRTATALWNLGCSIPTLANVQAQDDARTQARARMLQVLAAVNSAYEQSTP